MHVFLRGMRIGQCAIFWNLCILIFFLGEGWIIYVIKEMLPHEFGEVFEWKYTKKE